MNDEALMAAAARANPVPDDAYRGIGETEWGRETIGTIVATTPRRNRWVRRSVAIAAAAAVLAGVVVASIDRQSVDRKWSPALVRMAQESPRLLIAAPGWRVTRADDYGAGGSEMTFENGQYWVDLHWYPGELYQMYVDDRRREADATERLEVAGHDAVLFRHDGMALGRTTFYVLWQAGPHAVELRTDVVPTTAELRAIAASVEVVGVDEWLAALPDSVVKPDERRDAVEKAAADIPMPSNVDLERLATSGAIAAGTSLEYDVATAAVCGWIDQWAHADDAAARREAIEALDGAHRWRVFRDGGMMLEVVEEVAAAMKTGEPVFEGAPLPVARGYRRHIGCHEGS